MNEYDNSSNPVYLTNNLLFINRNVGDMHPLFYNHDNAVLLLASSSRKVSDQPNIYEHKNIFCVQLLVGLLLLQKLYC